MNSQDLLRVNPAKDACDRCDLEALRRQIPLCTPEELQSCIGHCIHRGFIDGLRLLIEAGVPIDYITQETIIRNNWITLVEILLERGTNMDFIHLIHSIRSIEMVDFFLAHGYHINQNIDHGATLLMGMMFVDEKELIGGTRHEFLRALLARGANLHDTFCGMNGVAMVAIQNDDLELLQFCDEHNIDLLSPITPMGAFIGAPTGNLLHGCVFANAIKCAQYLLDRGIDRTVTDVEGKLAYEMELRHEISQDEINLNEIKNIIQNYEEPLTIKEPVE